MSLYLIRVNYTPSQPRFWPPRWLVEKLVSNVLWDIFFGRVWSLISGLPWSQYIFSLITTIRVKLTDNNNNYIIIIILLWYISYGEFLHESWKICSGPYRHDSLAAAAAIIANYSKEPSVACLSPVV